MIGQIKIYFAKTLTAAKLRILFAKNICISNFAPKNCLTAFKGSTEISDTYSKAGFSLAIFFARSEFIPFYLSNLFHMIAVEL